MLRLWLVKLLPFMHRWSEAAPASCCGVCPQCLTATATGLSLELAAGHRSAGESESEG